ncbi:MAG: hypothetical protein K0S01_1907 [Herbinix sp.]|jgi:hypothetical protein|nr:hypothetical protein [Herbinix sp.]
MYIMYNKNNKNKNKNVFILVFIICSLYNVLVGKTTI